MGRSKTRREMDACKKKVRFNNPPPRNGKVRPYYCKHCSGWHATSIVPKGRIKWPEEKKNDMSKGYRGFESKESYEAYYSDPANYAAEIQLMEQYTRESEGERKELEKPRLTIVR